MPLSFEYDYFRKEVWNIPEVIPDTFQDFLIHQNLVYHYVDGADDGGRYLKSVLPTPDSADSYNPILGELSHREAEKLCRFEGSDVVLNGWYSVDSTEVLQLLCNAKFSSLSIKVSAITSEVAKILVGFRASSLRVDAEDIDEEAARIIAACPKDLGVNLESLPRHVRAVLRKHPAMHEWGTVSLPMFSASCNVCGFEKTFELLDGDDHSYGMFYYTSDKRLEKEGWLEDDETGLAFCPSCNKDDRIQQYLDEARDYR